MTGLMGKADLTQPLQPIYRIVYCGNCKNPWRMRGRLKVLKRGLKRTFTCPYCHKLARQDWFEEPTNRAIEVRENAGVGYSFDSEHWELNRVLLEQSQ